MSDITAFQCASSSTDLERTYLKVTRKVVPLLFFCYLLAYLDRINIGYAQLQMRFDLHFSDAVYGLGASMFFVGYVLFEVPSNVLLKKVGARKTMLRIMLCWGVVSMGTMFVANPLEFYVARFFLGVFEAGFFPGILFYLTLWFPADRRARIVAFFMAATVAAGLISGPVSGYLLQNMNGIHGLRGWQWMFLLEGLPTIFLGIATYLLLVDQPSAARWLSVEEKDAIARDLAEKSPGVPPETARVREVFRDMSVLRLAALYFAMSCAAYALSFWMPSMIERAGAVGLQRIGLLSLIPYACGVVAMIWYSRHSDRTRERRWHFACAVLLCAVTLSLCNWTQGLLWTSVALISVALAAVISSFPVFWAVATSVLRRESMAVGIAIVTSLGAVSGIICPYAIGLIKTSTGSLNAGLYSCSLLLLVASVVMLRMKTDPGE
ncbi:Putative tartrate transporter [Paraburkholderia hiiakae]|uniref:Tartrate transporter n=1 Tax=Paraburkholderia hiiakae TaxID=1081782 RepID=A0ABM8NMT4_9BURK|nr:MFS transporter [Paraburkholderia hiiakae]CAD6533690.1 Putative tartrate transporter [Paraburkholderia hiiakae]